jgi:hypothetical protein
MATEDEREKLEKMAPSPGEEEQEAHSLEDAVDSHGTLEGYFAMNNIRDDIEAEALELEKQGKRPAENKD